MYNNYDMKVGAIVEARMTSSRLPGKVMLPVIGRPALDLLLERLKQSPILDKIVIATTVNHCDTVIEDVAKSAGCECFRGSELDVLERVYLAAQCHSLDVIVEITGDCPLVDPNIITRALSIFKEGGYDYVSNVIKRTYPRGLDVQVFSFAALREAHISTTDPADREHAALYIYERPERFRLQNFTTDPDLSLPEQRLTLDEPEDYFVIRAVFDGLYKLNRRFRYKEIYDFCRDNPHITSLNNHIVQKSARGYDFTAKARRHLGL